MWVIETPEESNMGQELTGFIAWLALDWVSEAWWWDVKRVVNGE